MHIIIGLALGAVLLYGWLIGHWFARVLVFLLLGFAGFWVGASLFGSIPTENSMTAVVIGGLIGVALMWPVAGLPTYYWRWQARRMTALTVARVQAH